MATTSEPATLPPEQRFLLRGVDWQTYRKISEALTGRHVRLTYDRGNLELMTISSTHGNLSRLLVRFVGVLTEELELPLKSVGDMTCDREDLERGIEPDEGFYIESEALVREKQQIDLAVDPPPDLAVEIDLSRSPKSRMGIYSAIRVPEVWRYDGEMLQIHHLQADGTYQVVDCSPHFPFVRGADLVRFLNLRTQMDENALIRRFRDWVREQIRSLPS